MTLEAWLLFCATETLLCLTPGPAVLLVVSIGMTRGARAGVRASAGILTANALYFAISATGLGAILLASWNVFFAVKWIGAAYLVWVGVRMLFGRTGSGRTELAAGPDAAPVRAAGFRYGFVTQAANPKSLVFFMAILPQFLDPSAPLAFQVGVLGVSSITIELVVLVGYAALASRGRRFVRTPRAQAFVQRCGGALLIAAAARIAALRGGDAPAAALP